MTRMNERSVTAPPVSETTAASSSFETFFREGYGRLMRAMYLVTGDLVCKTLLRLLWSQTLEPRHD